ncbi:ATP-binding cassette domain-containing protein [Yimella sp. cx-51]|nr:ATP-binding cassette domain-containing protein [Yimella sp. cx-51]QTH36927.1 ATP-binding cassette domain-containing protein [Yimella sp. cx-51]
MSLVADDICVEVGGELILPPTSVQIGAGESVAVTGPSGSGKSTFLDCISGWRGASGGSLVIGDTKISALSARQRSHFRRASVGVIFQEAHLLGELTVAENVGIVARFRGDQRAMAQIPDVLSEVGLGDRARSSVSRLSGGEAQRVAVARAVVSAVGVLVADEPTAALDRVNADLVAGLLVQACRARNIPLVLATHDPAVAARCTQSVELGAS